jgi:hypothetical protein
MGKEKEKKEQEKIIKEMRAIQKKIPVRTLGIIDAGSGIVGNLAPHEIALSRDPGESKVQAVERQLKVARKSENKPD